MKRHIKFMMAAGFIASLALSACATPQTATPAADTSVLEADQTIFEEESSAPEADRFNFEEEAWVSIQWAHEFPSVNGTILEINPHIGDEYFVVVDAGGDAFSQVSFLVDQNTVVLLDSDLEPGATIIAFHDIFFSTTAIGKS